MLDHILVLGSRLVAFSRFRGGLRGHLILLVLVTLVPMMLWAWGLTFWSSVQERRVLEIGLTETAHALVVAVDQEVRITMSALESAAMSRLLTGDVAEYQELARQLVAIHPDWNSLAVFDPGGRQLFNTLRPQGAPLPDVADPAYEPMVVAFHQVMDNGRPAVSGLFVDPLGRDNVMAVMAPVFDDVGRVSHVLVAALPARRMADLLHGQRFLPGWFAAIDDGAHVNITRVPGHEQTSGKPAPPWLLRAMNGMTRGVTRGASMVGDDVVVAFERSGITGWTVLFGTRRDQFDANLRGTFGVTVGFGVLVLLGSLILALAMSRRILGPVEALSAAVRPFIPDDVPAGGVIGITELDALHRALDVLTGELAKTQQRFLTFFSAAPVMLFVQDQNGHLIAVNDAWTRTLHFTEAEVLGRRPWDFHSDQSRATMETVVVPEFLRTGHVDAVAGECVTKEGDVRDVLVSLRADRDGDGVILRTIGAIQDVTEQRRAEAALARAVRDAERANDSKTRFLAAASHDLRQPLQALSLYLAVLKARLNGREDQVMDAVGQCVESLTGLLNDMLDVARLDAGVISPKVADVPVSRLLERVAAAWRIQAEAKGLTLCFTPCTVVVRTDPALMDRVLSNLVANAVRYTEHGRILVACRNAGPGMVRLEVRDSGIGIPADKLGEIFEEFRQLGNPERRRDKGTGLGLSIVHRIAELLGHQLSVHSIPGRGSVFAVTLPKVQAVGAAALATRTGARHILVVDDDIHVRNALELVLGQLGHAVELAGTLEAALLSTTHCRPELVIADYRLDGIRAIREIRAVCGDQVAGAILAGDTDAATLEDIREAGLQVLCKPLNIDELRAFLRQLA